jgi:hypothetical protein
MAGQRTETVAIMAAMIYTHRAKTIIGQQEEYDSAAKDAWDLYETVDRKRAGTRWQLAEEGPGK